MPPNPTRSAKAKHPFPQAVFSPCHSKAEVLWPISGSAVAVGLSDTIEGAADFGAYDLVGEYHLHKVWRVKRGTTFEEIKP